MRIHSAIVVFLSCNYLLAATIGAPNLGFLFDPTAGAIRPISGIPGAAIVGDGWMPARNAAIAPGQRFGLVDGGESEPLQVWRLTGSAPTLLHSLNAALRADRVMFSTAGNAAVLINFSDRAIQVITGLPDSPMVHAPASAPEGALVFAVNNEGDVLTGGDLAWLLRQREAPKQLAVSGPVSAVAIQGSDMLVAGAGQILLIRDPSGRSAYRTLATYGEDRVPATLQFSFDATRALAATADGEVLVLSLDGDELARIDCRCRVTGFHRLTDNSLFRLNDAHNGPIWILDSAAQPRLWFVPKPLAQPEPLEGSAQ
jgi:hypothetical protein